MKVLLFLLKLILAVPVILFGTATFLGGALLQTASLGMLLILLFFWPKFFPSIIGKTASAIVRLAAIAFLVVAQFTFFAPGPKESIYHADRYEKQLIDVYKEQLSNWPDSTESIWVETQYGKVHVLAYGDKNLPPLLLFHAASMGAHSWAENLDPLIGHYRIYAVDNPGEGNRSRLYDPAVFPQAPKDVADLYAHIATELNILKSPVFGASNGGFIAQIYAFYHPEKVESLVLLAPMGLTKLTNKSIMMLSVATMYPFNWVREKVTRWALGDDPYVRKTYGDWFEMILKGTVPSVAKPEPMTREQKAEMKMPVLLFLGTKDPIVGGAEEAKLAGEKYPNIEIEVLDSGHLIGVEKRGKVNERIKEFLQAHRLSFNTMEME